MITAHLEGGPREGEVWGVTSRGDAIRFLADEGYFLDRFEDNGYTLYYRYNATSRYCLRTMTVIPPPLHGIEYEFQLVTEIGGVMQTAYVDYFDGDKLQIRPVMLDKVIYLHGGCVSKVKADVGNIEIATEPYRTYKEAVAEAEDLLNGTVVPRLSSHLSSFALFLPAPMSVYNGRLGWQCLKHWNIDRGTWDMLGHHHSYPFSVKKGIIDDDRIEVKIPYHFTPPLDVSQMPVFEDTIIPLSDWRPLVGYYRSGKWHQIRPLR